LTVRNRQESPAAVDVRDVSVDLAGSRILHDISFDCARGRWIAVIGPNGSGKTTLLRAVGGLVPYDGHILVDDRDVDEWTPRALARRLAFVRQSHPLSFDFSVQDLVLLGRSPHKSFLSTYDPEDYQRVRDALRLVDLEDFQLRAYDSLSGGEQQRVFLAQALVQEAGILLLDEPTTYLDVHHQFEFMEHVHSLVREGMTVIGAIHDLELAARYADAVIVLDRGRKVADGTPETVLTADVIESVFRMRARIDAAPETPLRIHYQSAL
jgi:iron complex transport system ATP-binding protein